jgi:hypothetical protein
MNGGDRLEERSETKYGAADLNGWIGEREVERKIRDKAYVC